MDIERAVASGVISARVAAKLKTFTYMCAGCRQTVTADMDLQRRDDAVFHHECARMADHYAREHVRSTNSPVRLVEAPPRPIAILAGVAVPLTESCQMFNRDGEAIRHDVFDLSAFDDSVRGGTQRLLINHGGAPLAGHYDRIAADARQLKFRFTLYDGPRERMILRKIQNGDVRFCSIGWTEEEARPRWPHMLVTRARLHEISVLDDARPAWFGTSVTIERLL